MKIKRENILPLLILTTTISIVGCNNEADSRNSPDSVSSQDPAQTTQSPNTLSPNTTEPTKQEAETSSAGNLMRIADAFEPSKQPSSSVIEIQETKTPEKKEFLDENSFKELLDDAQYNVIYFKFNKEELKKPNNLKYWIALNSCDKVSKMNNEFEWPNIVSEYSNSIDTTLEKIPTTINVMLKGYFGQYDLNKKSFPVLAKVNGQEPFKVDQISLSVRNKTVCDGYIQIDHTNSYILDLSQEVSVPKIEMNEEAAKDFVTRHPDPYSREVIFSIDADVTGIAGPGQHHEVTFNATPKKMKVLDGRNKDIVIHEFNFQVVK